MRHGHRPARGDLLLEDGDDAAVRAEHVAEAHGDVLGPAVLQGEEQQFGDALGGAHDVGGPHGFVGGDHDEVLDSVLGGGHGDVVGPEDVVLDGLEDVRLHQGNVLVGGGVIDDRRRVLAQDLVQASAILDAADLGVEGRIRERLAHFAIDFEQRGFGDFESDDAGGVEACDLPAEFGADGARRAGDQDDFAFERARIWSSSRRTGLRPRRSSTATSRIWPARPLASTKSPRPGIVLQETFA